MPFRKKLDVGDEHVVAHELDLVAEGVGQFLPGFPVVLGAAVLDGDDRIFRDELPVELDHLVTGELAAVGFLEHVLFRRGVVEFEAALSIARATSLPSL